MCETRSKTIKKGSRSARLREARRLRRIQRMTISPPTPTEESRSPPPTPSPGPSQLMDKDMQDKVLLQLALKTIALLERDTLIQQKIAEFHKQTYEYVAAVMSIPENRQRYLEEVRLYGTAVAQANVLKRKPSVIGHVKVEAEDHEGGVMRHD